MGKSVEHILPPREPIAIIRLDNLEEALRISQALLEGGITRLEFTLSNKRAPAAIEQVRREFGDKLTVGAGTVLDVEMAQASIQAGAQFIVTPALLPEVIAAARGSSIPIACGAYTPTEILTAWRAGADLVKVFPAGQLGPTYLKDVLAPLPDLKLVPTGGVNLQTCGAFLAAGAYTVAVGSQLVGKDLVSRKDWSALSDLARQYIKACK
ncbi:bifunctional 4-hydroxy-2-oxoglutarate aldolase/2-dehydro-3-deoxy-phosphogluconate aldolase [Ktedonosporobacter rubrisoli]|uniref:Bifunctional 4-hydroxy-2-oxoglutarate aldolase/2-dehydro-3-deoxy-phosphogluconate aldolase n=1 Tax=Ktedonosporobacter rubrisoli TaxID=2509675 RepID=A0A4P6JWR8_KTERU|nr:bifunctional 4-hydroxy-2-oxoglutarate aldolase/2-dehydro-3-deoxy-phosphogluconate aldolase [Ktedonosporobacter rubrisoli]QBD80159.1 bifunctional 4-hydroxy-2-oxoglutarate aldolase/2-dehydro-3-deoxy-phosphogluconate aldolase [Ktedonosporobacter rubrisoli]